MLDSCSTRGLKGFAWLVVFIGTTFAFFGATSFSARSDVPLWLLPVGAAIGAIGGGLLKRSRWAWYGGFLAALALAPLFPLGTYAAFRGVRELLRPDNRISFGVESHYVKRGSRY